MKKIIILVFVFSTIASAFTATIKQASVRISINDLLKDLNVDDKVELKTGDIICYISGKGRIIIEGEVYQTQLSNKSSSCKQLPNEDEKITSHTVDDFSNIIVSMFQQSKEKSVDGIARARIKDEVLVVPIYMSNDAKYLLIKHGSWGPLPVTLELYDEKGNVMRKMVNKNDVVTSFMLPKTMMKEGFSIKITNRFGEPIVKSKIHF